MIDKAVVNGTTYNYDIYSYDISGNVSGRVSASATPVSAVSVAVETNTNTSQTSIITTENFKPIKKGEIKADIKEAEKDTKAENTEVKGERKIPVWGILFLLILAAIGGYLFYVQNPDNFNSLNGKK